MTSNYSNSLYKQYEELVGKFEIQEMLLKETNELVSNLNSTIRSLNETIVKLENEKEELKKEILRLKNKSDKDSSNSSKPSSTNGYKKVITNRREKSDKSKGAQKFHKPHSLKNKLEQFINSGNVEEEIIEINKNDKNKDKRYISKMYINKIVLKNTEDIKCYSIDTTIKNNDYLIYKYGSIDLFEFGEMENDILFNLNEYLKGDNFFFWC